MRSWNSELKAFWRDTARSTCASPNTARRTLMPLSWRSRSSIVSAPSSVSGQLHEPARVAFVDRATVALRNVQMVDDLDRQPRVHRPLLRIEGRIGGEENPPESEELESALRRLGGAEERRVGVEQ